jgi:hypothetical protein
MVILSAAVLGAAKDLTGASVEIFHCAEYRSVEDDLLKFGKVPVHLALQGGSDGGII